MDKYYVHYIHTYVKLKPFPYNMYIPCHFEDMVGLLSLNLQNRKCNTYIIQSRLRVCVCVQIQIVHVCMHVHVCEVHGML